MLLAPREERELIPPHLHYRAHGGIVLCVADIGIYACSSSVHLARMRNHEEQLETMSQGSEHIRRGLLQHFSDTSWTPWLYNQTLGWLRIFAYPRKTDHTTPCVTGEWFAIDAKRLSRDLKRKRYLWAAEAFAISFDESVQTRHAFARISKEIHRWARTEKLRKLTVNLEVWESLGPYIRWRDILCPDLTDNRVQKPR